jgi:phosphoserine phosphatase RsbU/P
VRNAMRALIAEDDLTSRFMLSALLKKWGFDPIVTEDGARAWEEIQKPDAPKLIILDWSMPVMDGLEVCRRIRQMDLPEEPYIIILTARGEKGDVVQGLEAGANDFISKPYDQNELRARLNVGRRMVALQTALAARMRDLAKALEDVKTLQGIIPICSYCKRIRDDKEYWHQVESYVCAHSEAQFSHSICPECYEKYCRQAIAEMEQKTVSSGPSSDKDSLFRLPDH